MQLGNRHVTGFTLIEIAIVLLVVSLLLSAILVPLGGAFEESQRRGARAQVDEVIDAIIGFAIARSRLPCPATGASDGAEVIEDSSTGECEVSHGFVPVATLGLVGELNADGLLLDTWNNPLRYSVTSVQATTDVDGDGVDDDIFVFTFTSGMQIVRIQNLTPDLVICTSATTDPACPDNGDDNTPRANQIPAVVFSMGKDWNQYDGADQRANAGEGEAGDDFIILEGGNTGTEYPIAGNEVFVAKGFTQVEGAEKFDDIITWLPENILYTRMIQAGVLP
ncbi:MAG: prepilin-type N-terminal cleavage/methylation domain-containing protein [Pseudomonadota bacterium]